MGLSDPPKKRGLLTRGLLFLTPSPNPILLIKVCVRTAFRVTSDFWIVVPPHHLKYPAAAFYIVIPCCLSLSLLSVTRIYPKERRRQEQEQQKSAKKRIPRIMDNFDVTQLFSVEGLIAVVTGGGTGIGLCIFPI